jgi:hypothetical protein
MRCLTGMAGHHRDRIPGLKTIAVRRSEISAFFLTSKIKFRCAWRWRRCGGVTVLHKVPDMAKKAVTAVTGWGIVSTSDVANALGVTAAYVRKLERDGWLKKAGPGRFNSRDVLAGLSAFWKDEARRSSKSQSASRVTDARTQEIELRILDRSGELVQFARSEALAVVDDIMGKLRADLVAAPARITADLELRRKIETVLDDALRAAAKRAEDQAAGEPEDREPAEAGA